MIKDDFMKKILIGMFVFLLVFTAAMVLLFCLTGSTPDTLIVAVFGACAGEYSICGLIKNAKEKQKTVRLEKGFVEDYQEDDYVSDEDELYDDEVVCAPYEPVEEYISDAHDGDIEEEAID